MVGRGVPLTVQREVHSRLSNNGLQATALPAADDWLSAQMPVSIANKLLNGGFSLYTHSVTGKQAVRNLSYSISPRLAAQVRSVAHPTVSYVPLLDIASAVPNPYGQRPVMERDSVHWSMQPYLHHSGVHEMAI